MTTKQKNTATTLFSAHSTPNIHIVTCTLPNRFKSGSPLRTNKERDDITVRDASTSGFLVNSQRRVHA